MHTRLKNAPGEFIGERINVFSTQYLGHSFESVVNGQWQILDPHGPQHFGVFQTDSHRGTLSAKPSIFNAVRYIDARRRWCDIPRDAIDTRCFFCPRGGIVMLIGEPPIGNGIDRIYVHNIRKIDARLFRFLYVPTFAVTFLFGNMCGGRHCTLHA